ncbi:MAG: ABC transporter ATP-binding protein [Betaproteobacteria bacterium]|nr:ABC transporter ATP-binding protein [Betaproteobacteria bacterium]
MLEIVELRAGYGPVEILHGVSLRIPEGRVVGLLGANGSGKTTLMRAISGLVGKASGRITFKGQEILGKLPQDIARMGLSQVPQGRLLFPEMTVAENLEMGAMLLRDSGQLGARLGLVEKLFPILRERHDQLAGVLSGGEQQMLAIGRALMGDPAMILLDEPSIGLAPKIFDQILDTVRMINRESGATIFIAEQNVRKILALVDYAYVLESGSIHVEGLPAELKADSRIQSAYLGL